MAGEEWVRRILERELKRDVVINDDGSASGMYDLRIGPAHTPEVAVECVGAVDPVRTATWKAGPAKGPLQLSTKGDWIITLEPTARIKTIKKRIESLLLELEKQELHRVRAHHNLKRRNEALFNELDLLKVTNLSCIRMPGTGRIHLLMTGDGGFVDTQGSTVPTWLNDFLRDPKQEDVLSKLQRSGANECFAFVLVDSAGAPWQVESYLTDEFDELPNEAPNLPLPLSEAWVTSVFGNRGLRWDGNTWRLFTTRGEGIDD